jgi:hypothetical protein
MQPDLSLESGGPRSSRPSLETLKTHSSAKTAKERPILEPGNVGKDRIILVHL